MTASYLLILAALAATQPASPDPAAFAGDWQVDLSADPTEPYFKPMTLELLPDGTVSGLFYDSPIEAGRWETSRGRTCVSFRTSDASGEYLSSGCLAGSMVEGQTWSVQRNFLFLWNAKRAD